jgi:hypothetical protein
MEAPKGDTWLSRLPSAAAQYLGVSPSLLRKKRLQGTGDPQDPGPAYIQLSPSLIVYTIADLDAWLDAHPRRQSTLSDICEQERRNFHLLDSAAQAETIRRMAAAGMNDQSNEDLRALLNSGYKRGATIPRCVGPKHDVQNFTVYCATALAGLGELPDTRPVFSARSVSGRR